MPWVWENEVATGGAGICHSSGILLSVTMSVPAFCKRDVSSSDITLVKGHTQSQPLTTHQNIRTSEEHSNIPRRPPMTPPVPHDTSTFLSFKFTESQKLSSVGT